MIPVVGMFRGLFLGSVLVWYSSSVWKTMDSYYNHEFKKYMQREKQERRFPTENEVCRALPEAPCAPAATANAAAHDAAADAGGGGGGAEALGANAAPESGASSGDEGGGGSGGCAVNRDVTHTAAWRRRVEAAASDTEDEEDTCPALF